MSALLAVRMPHNQAENFYLVGKSADGMQQAADFPFVCLNDSPDETNGCFRLAPEQNGMPNLAILFNANRPNLLWTQEGRKNKINLLKIDGNKQLKQLTGCSWVFRVD